MTSPPLSQLIPEPPANPAGESPIPAPPGGWTPGKWWFVAVSHYWGRNLTWLAVAVIAAATLSAKFTASDTVQSCERPAREEISARPDRPFRLTGVRSLWRRLFTAYRRRANNGGFGGTVIPAFG